MQTRSSRIHSIVLAGTSHWGQSQFERFLRGPLVPIAQRPLVSYVLGWLRHGGISDATICANSSSPAVRDYLADCTGLSMRLSYYEDRVPRGTAGCVRDAGHLADADTFLVAEGALIPTADIGELLERHRSSQAILTVAVDRDRRRQRLGRELPPSPSGIYVFDRRALDFIPASGFQDIKESLIPRLYRSGERVVTHVLPGVSPRVLNCETYLNINEWMVNRVTDPPASFEGHYPWWQKGGDPCGDASPHSSVRMHPEAKLLGRVVLGPRVKIMPGATIVGPTTIGADCSIGEGAIVARSVLWSRCIVGEGAFVDHCLLADGAVIEPSAALFNSVRIQEPAREGLRLGWLGEAAGDAEPLRALQSGAVRREPAGSA